MSAFDELDTIDRFVVRTTTRSVRPEERSAVIATHVAMRAKAQMRLKDLEREVADLRRVVLMRTASIDLLKEQQPCM